MNNKQQPKFLFPWTQKEKKNHSFDEIFRSIVFGFGLEDILARVEKKKLYGM